MHRLAAGRNRSFRIESSFATLSLAGGILTFRVAGPVLAERETKVLSAELAAAFAQAGRRLKYLVIDLRDVHSMSSVGLGLCIDARNDARERRGATILFGLSSHLREQLRILRVDRLYRIVEEEEELKRLTAA